MRTVERMAGARVGVNHRRRAVLAERVGEHRYRQVVTLTFLGAPAHDLAIARHTGFDRKTVRKYLAGDGTPEVRARPGPDPFEPFGNYVTARLVEDPHLWARTLYDELEGATNFLSRAFSGPSSLSNLASLAFMPPHRAKPNRVVGSTLRMF